MRRSIYSAPKWRIIENKKRSQNPYKTCYFLVLPAGRSKAGPLSIIEFLGWSPKRGLGSSQTTPWLSVPAWSEVSLCWLTYGRSSCVPQRLWRHSMAVNSSQVINFNGCLQSGRALIWGASLALLHSSDTEDSSFMVSGPKLLTASSRFRFSLSQAGRERNFPGDLRFSRERAWIENNIIPVEVNLHTFISSRNRRNFSFRARGLLANIAKRQSVVFFCLRNYVLPQLRSHLA